jgi:hypothetical protein
MKNTSTATPNRVGIINSKRLRMYRLIAYASVISEGEKRIGFRLAFAVVAFAFPYWPSQTSRRS